MAVLEETIDIAVIGAGHAGCEAALAAARMGLETVVFTVSVDSIAMMPCNPNIGGTSKGHHKLGIDTCLISNNQEPRVEPFAYAVKSKYIFDAHKPSTKNYRKAMELMGTTPKNTLFLGDQIFTDIWGANRAGVQTVMLKKIDKKEEIQIVLKRIPEKFVLWRWRKKLQKTQ